MKLTKALFVLALTAALAVPAYAETQNVKVSGSIDGYWFYRNHYDLQSNNDSGAVPAGTAVPTAAHGGTVAHRSEGHDYGRTNTQIEVSADLTDNVSTVINLVNMRDWNADTFDAAAAQTGAEFDVLLDLAYVKMKEIFYSPLTLTVGRQDMWFGRGFILGNNLTTWDPQGQTQADEFSVINGFDAVRATLDFNPWTLDFVLTNVNENSHDPEDDVWFEFNNVNYKFAEYNAVAEGYYMYESNKAAVNAAASGTQANTTQTLGGRIQFDPVSQITLGAEVAYQFGDYIRAANEPKRDREAFGLDIFGTYRFDMNWKPELTLEYVHFSGSDDLTVGSTQQYNAWNLLYRGKFWTAISDFREVLYATADVNDQSAAQNEEFFQVKGSLKPLEDLLLEASFTYLWMDKSIVAGGTSRSDKDLGYEVDFQATYDYTEDVTFGFLAGFYVPGSYFAAPSDATASELVSSVKVAF